ncbi:MAG: hypothetical protein FWD92_00875 [Methanomassiliicoccaceae archaeon]|nr:hypothetical protein [Methanomassiliicoccaceae archaeon]
MEPGIYIAVNLFLIAPAVIILLIYARSLARKENKEMMIIDDDGLTIRGDVSLGPIPWDCILGAEIKRILFEKHLTVYLTDVSRMGMIFGEETIRKKVGKGKDGERVISIDLTPCKLKGMDIEALIRERVAGRAAENTGHYPPPGTKTTRLSKMETNKKIMLIAIIVSIPLSILGFWMGYTSV